MIIKTVRHAVHRQSQLRSCYRWPTSLLPQKMSERNLVFRLRMAVREGQHNRGSYPAQVVGSRFWVQVKTGIRAPRVDSRSILIITTRASM